MQLIPDDYKMNAFSEFLWRTAFKLYYGLRFSVRIFHQDRVPKEGAFIVAPNHMSYNDPPLIGLAFPRPAYFMAKKELFEHNWFFTTIIKWLGSFPVNRNGVDKVAIRRSMNIIKRGDCLGIFPQGGRRKPGSFDKLHDGVASMALRTGTPIIPIAIVGSLNPKRHYLAVSIGHPLPVEKAKPTPEAIKIVNDRLSNALKALYEETEAKLPLK